MGFREENGIVNLFDSILTIISWDISDNTVLFPGLIFLKKVT